MREGVEVVCGDVSRAYAKDAHATHSAAIAKAMEELELAGESGSVCVRA
jgi:hypothetical protein